MENLQTENADDPVADERSSDEAYVAVRSYAQSSRGDERERGDLSRVARGKDRRDGAAHRIANQMDRLLDTKLVKKIHKEVVRQVGVVRTFGAIRKAAAIVVEGKDAEACIRQGGEVVVPDK